MHRTLFSSIFIFISSFTFAQITDNFSDGDFTTSPAWSGDATEFTVNASQQLQLNNTVAGASYLSTASPGPAIDNFQWTFYIKQSFAPSSSNYGRVYLVSDQSNLEGALNGYYLQFGEAGSLDAVELFRQTGLASTSVCRGTNGEIAAAFAIGIKVTRDVSGNWNLYVDPAGGTAYGLEATGIDLTHITTNFFGVATVYTITDATKFYFDNFYNGPIIIDTTPPAIVSSTIISNTQLDILFNENVDLTTSQMTANYSADNGLGNPSAAARDAVNFNLVHLTFATAFTSGLLNTLTVINVQDLSANTITAATSTFTYVAPTTAAFKDVIFNEIMADESPVVGLPGVEFVEIYNRNSTSTFNLNGWKFSDISGSSTATLGNYDLGPNQYLIICKNTDTSLFTSFGNRLGVVTMPSLNNTGDNLYLQNASLTLIDSVAYSDSWYHDAVKKNGGWTLELINPNAAVACPITNNWIASNNILGGTPGTQNSIYSTVMDVTAPTISGVTVVDSMHITVCFSEALDASQISVLSNYTISDGIGNPSVALANSTLNCVDLTLSTSLNTTTTYTLALTNESDCSGNALTPTVTAFNYFKIKQFDIEINEIFADVSPAISLPAKEYVELYNKSSHVINLNGWQLSDATGSSTAVIGNYPLAPGHYLIICKNTDTVLFSPFGNYFGTTSFPSLNDSGDDLTLKDNKGEVVDFIAYADTWYQDATKKNGGWSLEQIDPNNPCAGMNNWRASVNPTGGTPGTVNSINASNPDHTPPQVSRVSVIAPDTIQVYFNEPLDSVTMLNPVVYTIDNSIGNPIAVKVLAPDFKSVRLALGTTLSTGTIYTVIVNNAITDCVGNQIGADNTGRFAIPFPADVNDIVINEILYDPNSPGVDYVEIYNRSTKVIDLKTMTLSQYDTINNTIVSPENISTDGYLLFPKDYLVLSENGSIVKTQYHTTDPERFLDMNNLPSLNISGGTVCLSTSTAIIDNFKYYADMQFGLLNITKGVSLERIDFDRLTQDRTNWHSAAEDMGFGTPGYKNSQYHNAGETDNALEITPDIFSPDDDGFNDVVNINYHFAIPGFTANVTIYDSKGRIVKLLEQNELLGIKGTISWDGIDNDREKARIGIYIIYFEVFDLSGNVKHYKKTCVLGGKV
ncbi:MAG: lamin tail domain-containing protein [Bacteroidia bacterium]